MHTPVPRPVTCCNTPLSSWCPSFLPSFLCTSQLHPYNPWLHTVTCTSVNTIRGRQSRCWSGKFFFFPVPSLYEPEHLYMPPSPYKYHPFNKPSLSPLPVASYLPLPVQTQPYHKVKVFLCLSSPVHATTPSDNAKQRPDRHHRLQVRCTWCMQRCRQQACARWLFRSNGPLKCRARVGVAVVPLPGRHQRPLWLARHGRGRKWSERETREGLVILPLLPPPLPSSTSSCVLGKGGRNRGLKCCLLLFHCLLIPQVQETI